jgi:hypothetical protein
MLAPSCAKTGRGNGGSGPALVNPQQHFAKHERRQVERQKVDQSGPSRAIPPHPGQFPVEKTGPVWGGDTLPQ